MENWVKNGTKKGPISISRLDPFELRKNAKESGREKKKRATPEKRNARRGETGKPRTRNVHPGHPTNSIEKIKKN